MFQCDLINCLGAHSGHIFADDLSVLIKLPVMKKLAPMIQYLDNECTQVWNRIYKYSRIWKRPMNSARTVAQVFHTETSKPIGYVTMNDVTIQIPWFLWSDILPL
jgi:hypothetical protein